MSSLPWPSSSAERRFSVSKRHVWGMSCDQAQDHKPLSLIPLASWCFSFLAEVGELLGSSLPVPFLPAAPFADSKATMLQPRSTIVNQRDTAQQEETLYSRRGHCGAPGKKQPEKLREFLSQQQKKDKLFHWWTTMLYFFICYYWFKNALACWSYSFVEDIFCCENRN